MNQRNSGKLDLELKDVAYENLWYGAKTEQRILYSNDIGFFLTKPENERQIKLKISTR